MEKKMSQTDELAAWAVTGTKWIISLFGTLWVAADTDIKILGVLAAADFAISLFNHSVSILLVMRRLAITFILVGTVHFVYSIARAQTGLNVGFDISALVAGFYCLGEAIKILKNADAVGIQLPPVLLDFVSKAEGITGADRQEIIALKLKQSQESVALDLKISQGKGDDESKIVKP